MRTYEIRQEPDGFVFECIAKPPETTPWGWLSSFRLANLTEAEAHRAGVFVRQAEDEPMDGLYERTEAHIGRDL